MVAQAAEVPTVFLAPIPVAQEYTTTFFVENPLPCEPATVPMTQPVLVTQPAAQPCMTCQPQVQTQPMAAMTPCGPCSAGTTRFAGPHCDPVALGLGPRDSANIRTARLLCSDSNPVPKRKYKLVVLGGGEAGVLAALKGASRGFPVALVEKGYIGGAAVGAGGAASLFLRDVAHNASSTLRGLQSLGVKSTVDPDLPTPMISPGTAGGKSVAGMPAVDLRGEASQRDTLDPESQAAWHFSRFQREYREMRVRLAEVHSLEFLRKKGIDVFFGKGYFLNKKVVKVEPATGSPLEIKFEKAIIATGSRPFIPPIPGLGRDTYTTPDEFFNQVRVLPKNIGILGAGATGIELASGLARFGANVTLIEQESRLLPSEPVDASSAIMRMLLDVGVKVLFGSKVTSVCLDSESRTKRFLCVSSSLNPVVVDELIVCCGRTGDAVNELGIDNIKASKKHRRIEADHAAGVSSSGSGRIPSAIPVDENNRMFRKWTRFHAIGDASTRKNELMPQRTLDTAVHDAHTAAGQDIFRKKAGSFLVDPFKFGKVDKLVPRFVLWSDPTYFRVGRTHDQLVDSGLKEKKLFTYNIPLSSGPYAVPRLLIQGQRNAWVNVTVGKEGNLLSAYGIAPLGEDLISGLDMMIRTGRDLRTLGNTDFSYCYGSYAEFFRSIVSYVRDVHLVKGATA